MPVPGYCRLDEASSRDAGLSAVSTVVILMEFAFLSKALKQHGNLLLCNEDGAQPERHDCHALLNVAFPDRFSLEVQVLSESGRGIFIGLVRRNCELDGLDVATEDHIPGFLCFVHRPFNVVTRDAAWNAEDKIFQGVSVEFSRIENRVFVASEKQSRVQVAVCPQGDFLPCISVKQQSELKVLFRLRTPAAKRTRDFDPPALSESLWTKRAFTDATVICGQKRFPVHRCVLASVSPFFAKAFLSELREGVEASVTIKDATPAAVEALLQYLYTQSLSEVVDVADLLPLAHRFECAGLVEKCADQMLNDLAEENVVKYVAALRPFAQDRTLKGYWADLASHIQQDSSLTLVTALMQGEGGMNIDQASSSIGR